MSFKEYLQEGKHIGTLYHFTRPRNLKKIISGSDVSSPFELISWNGNISCTRNACMSTEIFNNDFSIKDGYIVRISLDGDKISQKYKIKPAAGYTDNDSDIFNQDKNNKRVLRNIGEYEEVILIKKINILPFIKQIDIYNYNNYSKELYNEIKNQVDFEVNLVRKFKIVENTDEPDFFIIGGENV